MYHLNLKRITVIRGAQEHTKCFMPEEDNEVVLLKHGKDRILYEAHKNSNFQRPDTGKEQRDDTRLHNLQHLIEERQIN